MWYSQRRQFLTSWSKNETAPQLAVPNYYSLPPYTWEQYNLLQDLTTTWSRYDNIRTSSKGMIRTATVQSRQDVWRHGTEMKLPFHRIGSGSSHWNYQNETKTNLVCRTVPSRAVAKWCVECGQWRSSLRPACSDTSHIIIIINTNIPCNQHDVLSPSGQQDHKKLNNAYVSRLWTTMNLCCQPVQIFIFTHNKKTNLFTLMLAIQRRDKHLSPNNGSRLLKTI